jgi:cytidine deaminase
MLTDELRRELVLQAKSALKHVYAPYSQYAVGAALLAKSGRIYHGVNVENAAYPSSMCAERVALFKAVSEGEREFEAIAVVTRNGGSPCGACRQVLSEFGLEILVLIADEKENILDEIKVADLLPGAFGPSQLLNSS